MKTTLDLNAPAKPVGLPVYRGKGGLASGLDGLNNKVMLAAADRKPTVFCTMPHSSSKRGEIGVGLVVLLIADRCHVDQATLRQIGEFTLPAPDPLPANPISSLA